MDPTPSEMEFLDQDIDYPNGIVFSDPVVEWFRRQCYLDTILTLNVSLHD